MSHQFSRRTILTSFALYSVLVSFVQASTLAITTPQFSTSSGILNHEHGCEISRLLIDGSGRVDIEVAEDCGLETIIQSGAEGSPGLTEIALEDLAGEQSIIIHLLQGGLVHLPIQNATAPSSSRLGGGIQLERSDYDPFVRYTAPIVDAEISDSFSYTITDQQGNALSNTVHLGLQPKVADSGGDEVTACQSSSIQSCFTIKKGEPTGVVSIQSGVVHVYELVYTGGMRSLVYSEGNEKKYSISSVPGTFSGSDVLCSGKATSVQIFFTYHCNMVEGKRYYFNLTSATDSDGAYRMTVY